MFLMTAIASLKWVKVRVSLVLTVLLFTMTSELGTLAAVTVLWPA